MDARDYLGALQDVGQDTDMATGLNKVIDHLRRTLAPPGGDLTDGQLLGRFVASRDEASFAALERRHGPMVWRLCLRVLGHVQDAEDTFQATFLVLARKAATVLKRESVGSFLYGVAYRTSLKARAIHARRRSRERQVEEMPHPEILPVEPSDWLDHELSLLPEHYRAVIIACDLEGRSRKEAARVLRISEGTVSSRLARGRSLLAKRLSRYGLAGVSVTAALAEGTAAVHVPMSLLSSTTKAVLGQVVLSSSVEILVKGALKAMLLTKLKITVCVATLAIVAGVGATGLTYRATAQGLPHDIAFPLAETRRTQADDLEALRLEIEALRKSLQATRERVKSLEDEVSALKGQRQGPQGIAPGGGRGGRPGNKQDGPSGGLQGGPAGQGVGPGRGAGGPPQGGGPNAFQLPPGMPQDMMPPGSNTPPGMPQGMKPLGMKGGGMMRGGGGMRPKPKTDPVTDAENALKKLRENPGDKQATESLERALKQLKEREKPKGRGQGDAKEIERGR
jgi:RNA polymerase sigma factor (sigma-70 family)